LIQYNFKLAGHDRSRHKSQTPGSRRLQNRPFPVQTIRQFKAREIQFSTPLPVRAHPVAARFPVS